MSRSRRVGTVRVVFQEDVTGLRDQLMRELGDLSPCGGNLPANVFASWVEQEQAVIAWGQQVNDEVARGGLGAWPPSPWGAIYQQGRVLETALRVTWWPKFQAAGCVLPPQPTAPPEPALSTDNPGSPFAMLGPLEGLVKVLMGLLIWREVREWTR